MSRAPVLKKIVAIVIVCVVIAAIAAGVASRGGDDEGTVVQVEAATRGPLVVSITAPGEIRADTRVSLSARTSARIIELPFEEGDVVGEGDVLVRLDDVDAKASVRSAEANKRQAEAILVVAKARLQAAGAALAVNGANLNEATLELERQQSLSASNDTSRRAVESAAAAVERLKAQVETDELQLAADEANLEALAAAVDAAGAGVERARQTLDDTIITSPIAGVVTRLNAEVGEVVVVGTMNNAGTVILEVADLQTMICVAEVDEASVASVSVGQAATVRSAAYDDMPLPGVVRSVALAKTTDLRSDDTGYYEVEIVLELDKFGDSFRRLSGLTSDVEIETQKLDNVLRVPSQSVVGRRVDSLPDDVRDSEALDKGLAFAPVVYRIEGGVAVAVPVRIGESDLLQTSIDVGIEEGDEVVIGPFQTLDGLTAGTKLRKNE